MNNAQYTYIDTTNTNLVCCICQTPFIDPVTTATCSHTFCRDCITSALIVNAQCPVDRSPLANEQLQPAATIVRNLVDELLVICPYASLGCNFTPQRVHLPNHINSECQFVHVECSEPHCIHIVLRKDLGKHQKQCEHRLVECEACGRDVKFSEMEGHEYTCPATEITCVHCAVTMPRSALEAHHATCQHIPVPCNHVANGCPWVGPRHERDDVHLTRCPYEAIKGFFGVFDEKLRDLEKENSELRRTVKDLERKLGAQQRDLDTAKVRLGPWFKLPTQEAATAHARSASMTSNDGTPGSGSTPQRVEMRRRLSVPLNSAIFGVDESSPRHARTPSLGSTPIEPIANQTTGVNSTAEGDFLVFSNSSTAQANPALQRTYSNNPVAPLNIGSTLEGTLTSLRQSIVSLSGSLDSLERKQDIMLTTETLRMHEDVASLRAIVHGLRMQVHNIMMDRNIYFSNRVSSPTASNFPMSGPSLMHAPSLTSLSGTASSQAPIGGASYSTVSRIPHFANLTNSIDAHPDIGEDEGVHLSLADVAPEMGLSSAARYLNQRAPLPYLNLSPSVVTTSTVRRGPEGGKL